MSKQGAVPSERRQLATLSGALQGIAERARLLVLGSLAGLIAGLIVGGIGSRLAMRISFLAAGPAMAGAETEAGFTVGSVTADTLFLLFVGSFVGVFGGNVYVAVRPWIPGTGLWKGAAFGLLLLAMGGSLIIDGGNSDFRVFGPPLLNISLFALLFLCFGLLVALLVDRLDGALPAPSLTVSSLGGYGVLGILGLLLLLLGTFVLLPLMSGFAEIDGQEFSPLRVLQESSLRVLIVLYLAAIIAMTYALNVGATAARFSARWGRRKVAVVGYLVLALPGLVGLVLGIQAVSSVLQ